MKDFDTIRQVPAASLKAARLMTHKAVQIVSRAARANLAAKDDDSHSNLGWHPEFNGFLSHPLNGAGGGVSVGLIPDRLELALVRVGDVIAALALDGFSAVEAGSWIDTELAKLALKPGSGITLPYEMPPETEAIRTYARLEESESFDGLSAWFSVAASALSEFARRNDDLSPGPVRCWTHHYDLATEVNFQDAGLDNAATIGLGFSPGDEHYDEPYFYISPWSAIDVTDLPDLPVTGHWQTEGFVGIVATATEVLALADIRHDLPAFIDSGFLLCRNKLGV